MKSQMQKQRMTATKEPLWNGLQQNLLGVLPTNIYKILRKCHNHAHPFRFFFFFFFFFRNIYLEIGTVLQVRFCASKASLSAPQTHCSSFPTDRSSVAVIPCLCVCDFICSVCDVCACSMRAVVRDSCISFTYIVFFFFFFFFCFFFVFFFVTCAGC